MQVLEVAVNHACGNMDALVMLQHIHEAFLPSMRLYEPFCHILDFDGVNSARFLPCVINATLRNALQLAEVSHVDADEGENELEDVKRIGLRLGGWCVVP